MYLKDKQCVSSYLNSLLPINKSKSKILTERDKTPFKVFKDLKHKLP